MSNRRETQQRGRQPREVRFTISNPDTPLSDAAIDALARLLLSLCQQPADQQENVAA